MLYLLLWVELVMLAAAIAAVEVRSVARKKALGRMTNLVLVFLGWAALYGLPIFLRFWPAVAKYRGWFALDYILSIGVAQLVVMGAIIWIGMGRLPDGSLKAERWSLRWALGGMLASTLAAALTLASINHQLAAWMTTMREEAVATATSLTPPHVPEPENAAACFMKAMDLLAKSGPWPRVLKQAAPPGRLFPDGVYDDPEIVPFVASQQPMLALLREGAARKRCSFERDYTKAMAGAEDDQRKYVPRNGAQVMALETGLLLREGKTSAAVANLNALRTMARHQLGEPQIMSLLIASSVSTLTCMTLEEAVNSGRLTRDELAGIALGEPLGFYRAMGSALRAEEVSGILTFCNLGLGSGANDAVANAPGQTLPYVPPIFLARDLQSYRRLMARFQEQVKLTPAELFTRREEAERIIGQGDVGPMTGILAPPLTAAISRVTQADAYDALARVGLATALYRADHGQLPESPTALVPDYLKEWPTDPFDGKPMRFVATAEGVTIYSLDKDLEDNAGTPLEIKTGKGDLVFRIRK